MGENSEEIHLISGNPGGFGGGDIGRGEDPVPLDAGRPSKRWNKNSAAGSKKVEIERSNFQVYVDSCRLLPSVRGRQPDPRVKLFVAEDQVKETLTVRFNRCLICLFMRRKSQPASELQESRF